MVLESALYAFMLYFVWCSTEFRLRFFLSQTFDIEMNYVDYVEKVEKQKRKVLTHAGKLTSRRLHTLTSLLKRKQANLLTDLHKLCTSLNQDFIRSLCR